MAQFGGEKECHEKKVLEGEMLCRGRWGRGDHRWTWWGGSPGGICQGHVSGFPGCEFSNGEAY